MTLQRLLAGSFPHPGDEDRIRQTLIQDVGKDELGLGVQQVDGEYQFAYPIVALLGLRVTGP